MGYKDKGWKGCARLLPARRTCIHCPMCLFLPPYLSAAGAGHRCQGMCCPPGPRCPGWNVTTPAQVKQIKSIQREGPLVWCCQRWGVLQLEEELPLTPAQLWLLSSFSPSAWSCQKQGRKCLLGALKQRHFISFTALFLGVPTGRLLPCAMINMCLRGIRCSLCLHGDG